MTKVVDFLFSCCKNNKAFDVNQDGQINWDDAISALTDIGLKEFQIIQEKFTPILKNYVKEAGGQLNELIKTSLLKALGADAQAFNNLSWEDRQKKLAGLGDKDIQSAIEQALKELQAPKPLPEEKKGDVIVPVAPVLAGP